MIASLKHEVKTDCCNCHGCLRASWEEEDFDGKLAWLEDLNGYHEVWDTYIDAPFEKLPDVIIKAMQNHIPGTPS